MNYKQKCSKYSLNFDKDKYLIHLKGYWKKSYCGFNENNTTNCYFENASNHISVLFSI